MRRATPRFASAHDPRGPPLDPDFGIAFVLAAANDVLPKDSRPRNN